MTKFIILFVLADVIFMGVFIWYAIRKKKERHALYDLLGKEYGLTWQDSRKGARFTCVLAKHPYVVDLKYLNKGSAQVVFENIKSETSFFCLLPKEKDGGKDIKEAFLQSGVGKWLYQKMLGLTEQNLELAKFMELGPALQDHYVCLTNSDAAVKNMLKDPLQQFLIQHPSQVIYNQHGFKLTVPCPEPEEGLKPILEICRQLSV